MSDDLTDAEVLAELRLGLAGLDADGIERYAWHHPEGITPAGVRDLCRRLAAARRGAREAVAAERGDLVALLLSAIERSRSVAEENALEAVVYEVITRGGA